MPHYHLNLHNSTGFIPDCEGLDLPSESAARDEAIRSIRSIVSSEVREGVVDLNGRIEVVDGDGEVLTVVRFADAVRIVAGGCP